MASPTALRAAWPTATLSDDGFEDLQKFSGAYLLDAYAYGSFGIGDTDLQLRLGRQVVNWGESVFIQGVNQINPIDVTALRRPGTEVKEVLLPVLMAYANWGFSFGSVEAFYEFEWDNSPVDSCGTYWGPAEGLISAADGGLPLDRVVRWRLEPGGSGQGIQSFAALKGREASDSGQFGLALRFPVEAIDTEFGLYGMNVHTKIPVISARMGTHPSTPIRTPGLPFPIFNPAANGGLGGWFAALVGGVPQYSIINPADFHRTLAAAGGTPITWPAASGSIRRTSRSTARLRPRTLGGLVGGRGGQLPGRRSRPDQRQRPPAGRAAGSGTIRRRGRCGGDGGRGTDLPGYVRFDKTQFQVNALKSFSNILGAQSLLLVGEVGVQSNDVPDYEKAGNLRFGRAFIYGVGILPGATIPSTNPQPDGRKNDGYVTDFAWGYRMRARLDYDGLSGGALRVSPSLVWNHDVDGVAMDGQFIEDRQTLGLGLGFLWSKKYTVDLNYTWFADSAYNPLMDRDYYSVSVGVSF